MEIKSKKGSCKAKCRDGTDCLNKGKYSGFCRLHKKTNLTLSDARVNEYFPKHSIVRKWPKDTPLERVIST